MRNLLFLVCLLVPAAAFAQTQNAQAVVSVPTTKQWASIGATTRFSGTGLTIAYGQQDLFAPGTDGRFAVGYTSSSYNSYGSDSFSLELSSDALAYTRDPAADTGLSLIAYGGLGPRLLVQTGIYDYFGNIVNAYLLNIGGLGGLETRLNQFGVFLELDASMPVLGLVGPTFAVFPFQAFPTPKLTLGVNYFF